MLTTVTGGSSSSRRACVDTPGTASSALPDMPPGIPFSESINSPLGYMAVRLLPNMPPEWLINVVGAARPGVSAVANDQRAVLGQELGDRRVALVGFVVNFSRAEVRDGRAGSGRDGPGRISDPVTGDKGRAGKSRARHRHAGDAHSGHVRRYSGRRIRTGSVEMMGRIVHDTSLPHAFRVFPDANPEIPLYAGLEHRGETRSEIHQL